MEPSSEIFSPVGALLMEREVPQLRLQARAVLVVDDDGDTRDALSQLVSSWGYTPVVAGSAEEGERLAQHWLLDAALVDIFLPGLTGEQLLARLRSTHPSALLVGISALADPVMERLCRGMGADLFLGKPVEPGRLARALTR